MHPHCVRNANAYAIASQTHAISHAPPHAMEHASPEPRAQSPELGEGLSTSRIDNPSPNNNNAPAREVWQTLIGGLHALSLNDYGRPWPYPRRDVLARLLGEHDADLCIKAAREARVIVTSQDRAPNITALFEKKLTDLAAVRQTVRESLAEGGE
jgi:hypothetical protein